MCSAANTRSDVRLPKEAPTATHSLYTGSFQPVFRHRTLDAGVYDIPEAIESDVVRLLH